MKCSPGKLKLGFTNSNNRHSIRCPYKPCDTGTCSSTFDFILNFEILPLQTNSSFSFSRKMLLFLIGFTQHKGSSSIKTYIIHKNALLQSITAAATTGSLNLNQTAAAYEYETRGDESSAALWGESGWWLIRRRMELWLALKPFSSTLSSKSYDSHYHK